MDCMIMYCTFFIGETKRRGLIWRTGLGSFTTLGYGLPLFYFFISAKP